jgi:hypothetical protein
VLTWRWRNFRGSSIATKSTFDYFSVTREYLERYGKPVAVSRTRPHHFK